MTRSDTLMWLIVFALALMAALILLPALSGFWVETVYRFRDAQVQTCVNTGTYSLDQCIRLVGAR